MSYDFLVETYATGTYKSPQRVGRISRRRSSVPSAVPMIPAGAACANR